MRTWPSDKQIELQKDNEDNFDSLRLSETLLQLTEWTKIGHDKLWINNICEC